MAKTAAHGGVSRASVVKGLEGCGVPIGAKLYNAREDDDAIAVHKAFKKICMYLLF